MKPLNVYFNKTYNTMNTNIFINTNKTNNNQKKIMKLIKKLNNLLVTKK